EGDDEQARNQHFSQPGHELRERFFLLFRFLPSVFISCVQSHFLVSGLRISEQGETSGPNGPVAGEGPGVVPKGRVYHRRWRSPNRRRCAPISKSPEGVP